MRPLNLTLPTPKKTQRPTIELETDTESTIITGWEDGYTSPLASASPLPSPTTFKTASTDAEEITKEFAALDQLRKSVQKNLRLRPIKSQSKLPKVDLTGDPSFSPPWDPKEPKTPQTSYFTPDDPFPPSKFPIPSTSRPIEPGELYRRLHATRRPLLVDIRPLALHSAFHIRHSINIAIPTLILKRSRKPGGALQSLESIRQYITTEKGKDAWDMLIAPGGCWDGDVIVYDEEMDEKGREKENLHMGWALLAVVRPLLRNGRADYLSGGLSKAGHHSDLQTLIDSHDQDPPPMGQGVNGGLFQLKTNQPFHAKSQLELEPPSAVQPSISPLPLMPSFSSNNVHLMDASPSPPPSQTSFRRPPPPRRPSVPNLQKLDIKPAEAQPKLSLRTMPVKAATLAVPPINTHSLKPSSPSHLKLTYSTHSSLSPSLLSSFPSSPISDAPPDTAVSAYFTPPHTPLTPRPSAFPRTPPTAKPEDMQPPSTEEEEFPAFTVSTILPSFLFLGPELTAPEHVAELKELGVKQILNIAAECDDDQGLRLTQVFDSYIKIPMRDTVKEENIAKGVRQVCEILGECRTLLWLSVQMLIVLQMTRGFTQCLLMCTVKQGRVALSRQSWLT